MKILALGAHPDDIEIFMYGLLAICKKRGDEIITSIATDGSMGNVLNYSDIISIRFNESIKGLRRFGRPVFLNLEDGNLKSDNRTNKLIKNLIIDNSPDIIVTHAPYDYHEDHRALSNYVNDIVGYKIPILYCETLMGINFNPDYYIDITEVFEEKFNAILEHKSQRGFKFAKVAKIVNRFRAAQCNAPDNNFVECYSYSKNFPFSDIRDLLSPPPKIRQFYSEQSDGLI